MEMSYFPKRSGGSQIYTLMFEDIEVLDFEVVNYQIKKLIYSYGDTTMYYPVGLNYNGSINKVLFIEWFEYRTVPVSREHLKEVLTMVGANSLEKLLFETYALSLADHYWVILAEDKCDNLCWEKLNYYTNNFSEDLGDMFLGLGKKRPLSLMSPDSALAGVLKKKWKISGTDRYLVKGGTLPNWQEPFNEVFATLIAEELGMIHIPYDFYVTSENIYSICKNFLAIDEEIVPAYYVEFIKKKDNRVNRFDHYVDCCCQLGLNRADVVQTLEKMIVLDFLLLNVDRHLFNFGVIRNTNTLEIDRIVPNFDTGTALCYNYLNHHMHFRKELKAKPFYDDFDRQLELVASFSHMTLDVLVATEFEEKARDVLTAPWIGVTQVDSFYMTPERVECMITLFKERLNKLMAHVGKLR